MVLNPNNPVLTALFDKGYVGIKNIFPGAEILFKTSKSVQLTQQFHMNDGMDDIRVCGRSCLEGSL